MNLEEKIIEKICELNAMQEVFDESKRAVAKEQRLFEEDRIRFEKEKAELERTIKNLKRLKESIDNNEEGLLE